MNASQELAQHGINVMQKPELTEAQQAEKNMPRIGIAPKSDKPEKSPSRFGKKVKLINGTTQEDIDLFNRLMANDSRCEPSYTKSAVGSDGTSSKTQIVIEFKSGKYGSRNQSTARRTIIKNRFGKKTDSVIWFVAVPTIMEWELDDPIESKPSPVKLKHHEKLGIDEEELARRKFAAKIEDLPADKLEKLFELIESL